jgi:hypothetical protein
MNGDGLSELIVGAHLNDSNGNESNGATYVVFGKSDGGRIDLDVIATGTSTQGFKIQGEFTYDTSGYDVSGLGDVNGDGIPDLAIGAPNQGNDGDNNAGNTGINGVAGGAAYVVFGKSSGATIDLDDIASGTGGHGFKIRGETELDLAGISVSAAGDVNRDGLADLIIGAPNNLGGGVRDPSPYINGYEYIGAAYVVFGQVGTSEVNLSDIATGASTQGFKILGEPHIPTDTGSFSVSGAGDVNGDGAADLIVGAYRDDNAPARNIEGAAYVVFGKSDGGVIDLPAIAAGDTGQGFKIVGRAGDDDAWAGRAVSGAGDINGDGRADLLIGSAVGEVYLVFGKADGATVSLDDVAEGYGGIRFIRDTTLGWPDYPGVAVSAAGDVNGDDLADLLLSGWNGSNGGAYVVFGQPEWLI